MLQFTRHLASCARAVPQHRAIILYRCALLAQFLSRVSVAKKRIKSIGITYQ